MVYLNYWYTISRGIKCMQYKLQYVEDMLSFTWSKCMCIIPILGWETAGWPLGRLLLLAALGRLLAGPWEGCYCWLHWEAADWPLDRLAALGDCWLAPGGGWLAPGKAATTGCGWEAAGWPLGRLTVLILCCCHVVGAESWCWFFQLPSQT